MYEYKCNECYSLWEELQKIGDETPFKCKSCNAEGTVERLFPGGMSFILKGGDGSKMDTPRLQLQPQMMKNKRCCIESHSR